MKQKNKQMSKKKYNKDSEGFYTFICPICNKLFKRKYKAIGRCCSSECTNLKRNNTNLQKYGIKNVFALEEIKEKIKQTSLKRYNTESPNSSKIVQEHKKQTFQKKYNVDYSWQIPEVMNKSKQTLLDKYNVDNSFKLSETHRKSKITKLKRYGDENYNNIKKVKETCFKKYNQTSYAKTEECKYKTIKTNVKKYGTNYPAQKGCLEERIKNNEINNIDFSTPLQKGLITKHKNNTENSSKVENKILDLLRVKFKEVKYQYKSDTYPFDCDFYILEKDLYIEFQGTWTHGLKSFEGTKEDIEKLEKWKEKSKYSKYYKIAINVWTVRDPLKRQIAKNNNLNWIEFFTFNEFKEWYDKQ